MSENNTTNVPRQFGRYMAVAEFILGEINLSLATVQPKAQFVKTIKQIKNPSVAKNKIYLGKRKEETDELLSAIVGTFPVDLPMIFSLSGQTGMMQGYYEQRQEIYKSRI